MWENETVVLVTSLKKRLLGGNNSVSFNRISTDDAVPAFIKMLFKLRISSYFDHESPLKISRTPHFSIQSEEVDKLKSKLEDVIRESAFFPEKEVEEILQLALVTRLDYLIKPVDTMRRMLFENANTVDLSEMKDLLIPFFKVLPYAESLIKVCESQDLSALKQEDFGKIISDVLRNIVDGKPVDVILHDFSTTTDFMSESKGEEVSRIEGGTVQQMLADRNLWGFRRALEVEMKLGKEDFDAGDLEMTLRRYLELKHALSEESDGKHVAVSQVMSGFDALKEEENPVPVGQSDPVNPEPQVEINKDEWDLEDVMGVEKTEETTIDDPEDKTIAEKKADEKASEKKSSPMRIIRREQKNEEEDDEIERLDEPQVSETVETVEEKETEKEVESKVIAREELKELIDDKTKKGFVKKLFAGNNDDYDETLTKLEEAESWRVAKILIDNELFKRDVDPFSREAIKLVDLVYSRFYPEEGVVGGQK